MAGAGRNAFANAARRGRRWAAALALPALFAAAPALAQAPACTNTGSFDVWLADFKKSAREFGISQATIDLAFAGVTLDKRVIGADRNQKVFKQSFEEFSGRMISSGRLKKGAQMLKKYAPILAKIEATYGVPGPVIVAIWGLETDYGVNTGKFQAIRSLATLAYDCRRSEMFQVQLFDALRIIDRGDLTPNEMIGAWAGEMGQTQFMASSYYNYAVDFDGNGHRDIIHSVPDVLASTANYLKGHGWIPGQGWQPGEPNFEAILGWNKSQVYARTIALFALRLSQGS